MDKFLSIITVGLISFFAFVVTLFLLTEITRTSVPPPLISEHVAKDTDISEEELSLERGKLPIFKEFPDDFSTSTPVLTESAAGNARILTETEIAALNFIPKPAPTLLPSTNTSVELSYDTVMSATAVPIKAFVEPSSGIKLGMATISYANVADGETMSAQVREGIVFATDIAQGHFSLASLETENQTVFVVPTTKFFISGRPIAFSSLNEADVVRVEGQGYNAVGEIIADTVVIIGKFEVATTGS